MDRLGFEPRTFCLQSRRSSRLIYRPVAVMNPSGVDKLLGVRVKRRILQNTYLGRGCMTHQELGDLS